MNGYIANTDYAWYTFLKGKPDLDEVNFWQPSGRGRFQAIPPGAPFFFKLKKPYYAICGFGFFVRSSILPAWLAWDSFGEMNGAPDFDSMIVRIEKLRRSSMKDPHGKNNIGCIMISTPVFFERDDWIQHPSDWAKNIVQGSTYDLSRGEGKRIFEECLTRTRGLRQAGADISEEIERYGSQEVVAPRLGQGTFRVSVIDAYERACAVTSEHSLPALEASHIMPYGKGGEHQVSNGILFRSDIHRLFDLGYVTVTPEHHFEVSRRLREDYENGRSYYPLHGSRIHVPKSSTDHPDREILSWHNEVKFRG